MSGLTEFQAEVARKFFPPPASQGFLLAAGLTTRSTYDLDFSGVPDRVDIGAARDEFEATVAERGRRCEVTTPFADTFPCAVFLAMGRRHRTTTVVGNRAVGFGAAGAALTTR